MSSSLSNRANVHQALKYLGFVDEIFQDLDVWFALPICDLTLTTTYF